MKIELEWLEKGGDGVVEYSLKTGGGMSAEEYAEAVLKAVGPSVYNKAIGDAMKLLQEEADLPRRVLEGQSVSVPVTVAACAKEKWYRDAASSLRALLLK